MQHARSFNAGSTVLPARSVGHKLQLLPSAMAHFVRSHAFGFSPQRMRSGNFCDPNEKSRHPHLSKNCHKITTKTVTYNFIYQNDNSTDPPRARTLVSFVGGCVKLTKRFTHNPSPDPKKVTGSLLSISSQGHRHTIRDSFTLPLGGARHKVMVILASEQPEVWFGSRAVAIFFYSTKTRPPRRDFSDETKDEKLNG